MSTQRVTASPVIIVDDGELTDVRQLLAGFAVGFREEKSLERVTEAAACDLLVTSAPRALASRTGGPAGAGPPCRLHVVVYDTISRTVHRVLAQSGCDVVIGRPVHPAVFRLLLEHAIYSGPERRRRGRAAMLAPVKLKFGRRVREATLIQLSVRGCGLVSGVEAAVGQDLEVIFPPELTGGVRLGLAGRVLAVGAPVSSDGPGHRIAVGFGSSDVAERKLLVDVMKRHALGFPGRAASPTAAPRSGAIEAAPAETTVELADAVPDLADAAAELADAAQGDSTADSDPRAGPRKLYPRRVLAAGFGETRMLIGRDLSLGGMRVRPVPGLQLGDEFKIALYGSGEHAALVLKAVVARDDGWAGLVLHFRDVKGRPAAGLAALVEELPASRAAKGAEARAPGVVVSEILEDG